MLVLTRKLNESIIINDDIKITIVSVGRGPNPQIRIGIEAPRTTPVHRQEIYRAIQLKKSMPELTL